ADVAGDHTPLNRGATGVGIDAGKNKRSSHRVRATLLFEPVAALASELGDRDRALGPGALPRDGAGHDLDVRGLHAQRVRGGDGSGGMKVCHSADDGVTAKYHAAARESPSPLRNSVGVVMADAHALDRDAQALG